MSDRGDFNKTIEGLARKSGRPLRLPADLSVFFPDKDGRQDLMYEQDFGLDRHAPVYARARRVVEAAELPAAERALLLSYLDLFLGEYARAAKALATLAAERPSEFWPQFLHACAVWLWGDQERTRDYLPVALSSIEKAVAAEPKQLYSYVIRAGLRRELEDVPGRLEDAERVIRMAPDFVWARTERAEVLGETGHYRPALRELNRLIKLFPKEAWAWAQRGRLRGISGYYGLALADFEKAAALDPRCGPLLAWRGETSRRLGRYQEALADLDRSIALDGGYRLAWVWRGRVHLLQGRFAEAVKDFDEALRLEPREMLARAWRGEALWKLGEFARAARDFDEIYPAEPRGLWNARLKAHETQEHYFMLDSSGGKREAAFWADMDAGLARAKDDPWAWAVHGRVLAADGRVDEARYSFARALKLDPKNARALAWRGAAAGSLSDLDASVAADPSYRWAWAWRGRALAEQGRAEEALASFDRALDTPDQRYAPAHVWRGAALWALGRRAEAEISFRRAFTLDGKCKAAKEWLSRFSAKRSKSYAHS